MNKTGKGYFQKGHPQLNTGRTYIKKGQHLSFETELKKGHISTSPRCKKGHSVSETERKKCSEARRGNKNHQWKGGITPLVQQIRHCFKYRQWISDIFTRDDYTCQKCWARGGRLNAHHIKEFNIIFKENQIKTLEEALLCEELWNINNGITFCKECHDKL